MSAAYVDSYGPRTQAALTIRNLLGRKQSYNATRTIDVCFRAAGGAVGPRDYLTHWIHWYPAKMFHRIPREILHCLALQPGSVVLDPFCGSGTVLLEAALLGCETIGVDVNPMARLISRVKGTALNPKRLEKYLSPVLRQVRSDRAELQSDPVLDFWFKPEARSALSRLKRAIMNIDDGKSRDFFLVTLSSIVRRSSRADPSIAPPVRFSRSRAALANDRYRRAFRHAQSVNFDSVLRTFRAAVSRNLQRMAGLYHVRGFLDAEILSEEHEAAETGIPDHSVNLILTSPPYCGAQKYVRSLRLEMLSLGVDPAVVASADKRTLGTERISSLRAHSVDLTPSRKANSLINAIHTLNPIRALMVSDYVKYLDRVLQEFQRVLQRGAVCRQNLLDKLAKGLRENLAHRG